MVMLRVMATAAVAQLLLAALIPPLAHAQSPAEPPSGLDALSPQSGQGPMTIDASSGIEWRRDEKVYIATGNAKAVRGAVTVTADKLKAYYREKPSAEGAAAKSASEGGGASDIYRVEALNNVVIHTESDLVVGEKAVYDLDRGVMVLTGSNLRLNTGNAQTVTARDSLEYYEGKRIAVARGDAVAVQTDRRITADVLTAHLERDGKTGANRIEKVDGFGNVKITTPKQIATGAKGVYNLQKNLATLVGSVRVTSDQNQLEGDYADVDMNTGISRMLSGDAAGVAGSRVHGLLVPKSAENAPGGTKSKKSGD